LRHDPNLVDEETYSKLVSPTKIEDFLSGTPGCRTKIVLLNPTNQSHGFHHKLDFITILFRIPLVSL